jgi:hypothetical protein
LKIRLKRKDKMLIMIRIGEVTKVKLSLRYTQRIIHGTFSKEDILSKSKGAMNRRMPRVIRIIPKNWK